MESATSDFRMTVSTEGLQIRPEIHIVMGGLTPRIFTSEERGKHSENYTVSWNIRMLIIEVSRYSLWRMAQQS